MRRIKTLSKDEERYIMLSEGISNSQMRLGSTRFNSFCESIRYLYEQGKYTPNNPNDSYILEKLKTGSKGIYKGKEVTLDTPFVLPKGESKEFGVYRPSKTGKKDKESGMVKAVIVKWGDPNLSVKNNNKEASKSFFARHKCELKKDKWTSGWWACYAPELFGKLLKLSGGNSRW